MYESNRRGLNQSLVDVSKCAKKAFDREAWSLQQCVRDAVRVAAKSTLGSFANAPGTFDRILGVLLGRVNDTGESAKLKTSLSRTKSSDAQADTSNNQAKSTGVPPNASKPSLSAAHDPGDHAGCGA